jgi:hypothetical protein
MARLITGALITVAITALTFATGPAPAATAATTGSSATPGATNVLAYGADKSGTADSTAAFLRAEDAAVASTVRYDAGPTGSPQAVVYVPPGTYRLLRLRFRSNVRMEVSSGAVLEQAGGRYADASSGPALMVWDGTAGAPLTNVTLIGIGDSTAGPKALAAPLYPGWTVDTDFTFNLDPAATGSSDLVNGVQMLNVDGFLIQNVFSIENDSQPVTKATTDDGWWPQSRKAALSLATRSDSPLGGPTFYDPHNGTIANWYNVHAPKGFGANQVNGGHNVTFSHIFSRGGSAMRFETDASQGKHFGAEIRGVTAYDIAGQDCNRTVIFAPHAQWNYDVHVTHVQSNDCGQGVEESIDDTNKFPPGGFVNSTVADVQVTAGTHAQLGSPGTNGVWTIGPSDRAFAKDSYASGGWAVVYTANTFGCAGKFTSKPNPVVTTVGLVKAVCT